jgi:GNAT superfamily N-acetyltransferase
VPIEIRRVANSVDVLRFRELVAEYEASLPRDLRHGRAPDAPAGAFDRPGATAAFIGLIDGHPAACVAYARLDGATAVLMRLFVRPAYRGAGLARALVNDGLQFLRESGCTRVVLDTDADRLSSAVALYRSLGFVECPPYGNVSYANPTYFDLRL